MRSSRRFTHRHRGIGLASVPPFAKRQHAIAQGKGKRLVQIREHPVQGQAVALCPDPEKLIDVPALPPDGTLLPPLTAGQRP
jgi:hypothetical protein